MPVVASPDDHPLRHYPNTAMRASGESTESMGRPVTQSQERLTPMVRHYARARAEHPEAGRRFRRGD